MLGLCAAVDKLLQQSSQFLVPILVSRHVSRTVIDVTYYVIRRTFNANFHAQIRWKHPASMVCFNTIKFSVGLTLWTILNSSLGFCEMNCLHLALLQRHHFSFLSSVVLKRSLAIVIRLQDAVSFRDTEQIIYSGNINKVLGGWTPPVGGVDNSLSRASANLGTVSEFQSVCRM